MLDKWNRQQCLFLPQGDDFALLVRVEAPDGDTCFNRKFGALSVYQNKISTHWWIFAVVHHLEVVKIRVIIKLTLKVTIRTLDPLSIDFFTIFFTSFLIITLLIEFSPHLEVVL